MFDSVYIFLIYSVTIIQIFKCACSFPLSFKLDELCFHLMFMLFIIMF